MELKVTVAQEARHKHRQLSHVLLLVLLLKICVFPVDL